MNRSKRLAVVWCGAIALLGVLSPALGQEEGAQFPYFYVVTASVNPGMGSTYVQAVADVVAANKKHDQGRAFATFASVTGTGTSFSHFIGMQSMGDMDSWVPLQQVLAEALGEEKGASVMRALGESADTNTRILQAAPQLSNPPSEPAALPPPLLLHVGYRVDSAKAQQFFAAAGQYVKAARANPSASNAIAYTTLLGGEETEISFFLPLTEWSDLEGLATPGQVLAEAVGAAEAARIGDEVSKISGQATTLLAFVPALSNIPAQ